MQNGLYVQVIANINVLYSILMLGPNFFVIKMFVQYLYL
jgi:hypothetical protein